MKKCSKCNSKAKHIGIVANEFGVPMISAKTSTYMVKRFCSKHNPKMSND